ncbi:hypothetical protein MTP06_01320 [Streptomyces sp. PLM4]|uniref:Uncharacterized protein n=1 Tax=Streptomyces albidoflavus TaxID=1886 RepID=A0AA37C4F3_9ACTN|nr:hypothetical protein MTP06_01320 [Streptomyces sp. PLM4]GHI49989.1 hypothetical protein ScoT_61630 [Streptomyces albidoflavus]
MQAPPGRACEAAGSPRPPGAHWAARDVPGCARPGEGEGPDLRFSRRGRGTPGRDRMASFGCPWDLRYRHRRGVAYPSRPRCGVEKDTPDPREHIQDRQKGPPP